MTIRLRDVRKGDRIIERCYGFAVLNEALEDVRITDEGYRCRVKVVEGTASMADADGVVTLFESFDAGGHALQLEKVP